MTVQKVEHAGKGGVSMHMLLATVDFHCRKAGHNVRAGLSWKGSKAECGRASLAGRHGNTSPLLLVVMAGFRRLGPCSAPPHGSVIKLPVPPWAGTWIPRPWCLQRA